MFLVKRCVLFEQTGTTALFFAAQAGYMDVAQLLISHRAPVDTPSVVSADFLT